MCEQEIQGSEIGTASPRSGCCKVGWKEFCHYYVLPANEHFFESRRADPNRLPLLQLRVRFELLYRGRKVSYLQAKLSAQYRRVALNYVRVSLSW